MRVVVWCLRLQIFREIKWLVTVSLTVIPPHFGNICLFVCLFVVVRTQTWEGENRHLPAPSSLTRMARSTDTSKRPPNTVVVDHEGKCVISDEMTCAITS